jgi:hypothetical protein
MAMEMQATMGNVAVQRLVVQAQALHKPSSSAKPKKKKPALKVVQKPKAPPPPSFLLFGVKFEIIAGTVRPAGKKGRPHGWSFTPQTPATPASPGGAPSPAPAPSFDAERTMPGAAWTPQGGAASQVLERTTIQVSGSIATAAPIVGLPQGTTMAIPLDAREQPPMKSVAVGPKQADTLDLPAAALAMLSAGDMLKLTPRGHSQIFVFSTLVPDTGAPVDGLFFIGKESKLQGGVGIEGADVAPFGSTFAALITAGKITPAQAADQDVFDFLAEVEGGFGTLQTADTGVLSFGFAQWTAVSDLPQMLSRVPKAAFDRYLGKYGLGVSTPALGTPNSLRKFVPGTGKTFSHAVRKLKARNPAEHCLTLGGAELVSKPLHQAAADKALLLSTVGAQAQTAKSAWLAATTAAKKKKVAKTIAGLWSQLAGLPGIPAKVPKALESHPDQMADKVTAAAATAQAQAGAVNAGTQSVEAVRTNEWALRIQMAGKDEDVQAAQVEQAHDSFMGTLSATTDGIPNSRLMQSDRALRSCSAPSSTTDLAPLPAWVKPSRNSTTTKWPTPS